MKCGNCGHSRTWHLSNTECLYPEKPCDCKCFGPVVGFDWTSLLFFTGTGLLISFTGVMTLMNVYTNSTLAEGRIFMGTVSLALGLFFMTYMNVRTQRLTRQKTMESMIRN